MDVITALTVAVLVGWLATLIMLTDEDISLLDFIVGVFGAGLAEALAPTLGLSATGEFGLSLPGTLFAWAGATVLLGLVNLTRFGTLRRMGRTRGAAAPLLPTEPGA